MGSVIGTVFISVLASIVASWNIFDPIALGMACGVGSGSMMTAAAGTLGEIYPQQAENIMIMGGASDMLTGITGIYMGTFVGLPLTKNCMQYWNLKSVTKTVRRLNNGQKILFTAAWTAPHGFCYHGTHKYTGLQNAGR